jgi:excisionase family DNA binding protein
MITSPISRRSKKRKEANEAAGGVQLAMAEIHVLEVTERPFFTIATLAKRLQLGERTIRNYVESGEIPSYKFGRARRIDPEDVDSWLARRRVDRRAA